MVITKEKHIEMLADLESAGIERTTAINDTDKFSQAVCAFSNDMIDSRQPGYLLIGVKNDGTLSGLSVTGQLLQNLGALRSGRNIRRFVEHIA